MELVKLYARSYKQDTFQLVEEERPLFDKIQTFLISISSIIVILDSL